MEYIESEFFFFSLSYTDIYLNRWEAGVVPVLHICVKYHFGGVSLRMEISANKRTFVEDGRKALK